MRVSAVGAISSPNSKDEPVGAVLVVGGGIAGIQASLDLAESGYYVYLVESSPAIGGVMAQLDKTFPTNDCLLHVYPLSKASRVWTTPEHRNPHLLGGGGCPRGAGPFSGDYQEETAVRRSSEMYGMWRMSGCLPRGYYQ